MPSRVADLIDQHHAALVRSFEEEAGGLESAKGLTPAELVGSLPEYLTTLASLLRDERPEESASATARLEEAHIGLRLRQGYTQEEVTSEYVLLGRHIARLWEALPAGAQPSAAGVQRLFDVLDAAMERGVAIFTGYSVEDRQREKRTLRNLDALAPAALVRGEALQARVAPLLEVLQDALGAQGVELLLVDAEGRRMELAAGSGLCPPPRGPWSVAVEGAAWPARVASTDEPLILSKVPEAWGQVRDEVCQSGLQGLLGLRLWPQGRLLGTVHLGFTEARPIRPEVKRYFQLLVEHLASQLDRALLAGQLQRAHAAAQAARAEAEAERARLMALFENAPAVVCTLRGPGHVIERANSLFLQAVGSTREVVGLPFRDALPELVPQGFVGLLDQVFRTGEPYVGREVPVLLHRGAGGAPEETWFTFIYQPTRDAEGRASGVDVFGFEVTEQVRARRRAEAATEELEAIFLCFPEALYAGDMTGLKRANLHALEMLGYSTLGELNRNLATLIHELHVRRADTGAPIPVEENNFVRALQGEASTVEVLLRHHGTGQDRVMRSSYAPIVIGGKVVRAVAVGIDITERRRAEEALRRSEEHLRRVVDATGAGSWELDPATGRLRADARLLELFWLPADTPFSLEKALAIVHPGDREHVSRAISGALSGEGGGRYEVEYRTVAPDGRVRHVAAQGQSYFDASGRTVRFVGTGMDITARKHTEQALRERAGFEQQLIGIVSHDLRNPLSAILLAAQALLRREELDERSTKAVTRIQTAAERASRMVRDLLDFTQARLGGGLRLALKPLDFDEAVHTVVEEVQATHPERELRLEAGGAGQGDWDGDRLSQLVTNLLTNAVKYGAPGTPVTVRTGGSAEEVTLEVHNLGAPISPSMLPLLFQPMQRGTAALPGAERSVGLGLYIVDQVVRAHGGALQAASTQEVGTTFTVRLPRRPRGATEP